MAWRRRSARRFSVAAGTVTTEVPGVLASMLRENPPIARRSIDPFSRALSAEEGEGTTRRATQAAMFRRRDRFLSNAPVFTRKRSAEEK